MITESAARMLIEVPTKSWTEWSVVETVEAGEAPVSDLPTPGDVDDLFLLLLALAALLSPNRDGEGGPVEDAAIGYQQDLEFAWSF